MFFMQCICRGMLTGIGAGRRGEKGKSKGNDEMMHGIFRNLKVLKAWKWKLEIQLLKEC